MVQGSVRPQFQGLPLRAMAAWRVVGRLGRAAAHLLSRSQPFANNEGARCSTVAMMHTNLTESLAGAESPTDQEGLALHKLYKPAGVGGQLAALDMHMGRTSNCSLLADPDLGRTTGYEGNVTAETVSKLCQQGQLTEAVEALGVLVHTGCHLSKSLFHSAIRECVAKKDLALGRAVHALTVKKGYDSDTSLCNHILRMYASHARLQEVMDVFNVISTPDAFTWCAIISAHVKRGQDKQAIELYRQMRRSSVKPNGHVFVAALQACVRGADLRAGQQVHADVLATGVEPDLFVCSCLVDMYAKCGSLQDAKGVFDGLPKKDVVTWNAMIAGYSQKGMGQEALHLYAAMQEEGMATPNSVTFVCLLQACASVGNPALEKGRKFHSQIKEQGLQRDEVVGGSLVNMYAKCGSVEDAHAVFDGLGQKSVVTWSALIAGYSQLGRGQEALRLYTVMHQEGIAAPNSVTFVCLLQACASVGTAGLKTGQQLHAEIKERGFLADVFVSNSLVNMYAKCGSIEDAQGVFDGLGHKNVVTWSTMISAYSQQGMGQEALSLYEAMQREGSVIPNPVTFVCLLQACASVGAPALEEGKQLHAQIREQGHMADVFVANSLINMYAKCGCVEDARVVFDGLCRRNVVTWNAMIAGYSQQGMGQDALLLHSCMIQEDIVAPNSVTFVSLLQACATMGSAGLEKGRQLHTQIRGYGLQTDVFVANSLVNMYAKCGSLEDAQVVFDGLREKTVVTWNAMIAGYSQRGMGQEALNLHSAMQQEGIDAPNSVTLACLLQACASVGTSAVDRGKQLHAHIKELALETDVFVASSLVNMYAKCGSLEDAQRVFDGLPQKDLVTWNAMIGGYSQQGMGQESLRLYRAMQEEGIVGLDSLTFVCLLQACASVGNPALEIGRQLHSQIREQGLQADVLIASSLVNMYGKCGSLEEAHSVFDGLGHKNVVTWSVMIAGYAQQGMGQDALRVYKAMQEEGIVAPNSVTFVCLLQACASVAALQLGRQLHGQIKDQGLEGDELVACSLINMYGKCGSMVDAQQVFETLAERDVVSWNALIAGYSRQGDSEKVFDLVVGMGKDGLKPDGVTLLSILTVCSHTGLVKSGQEYFEAMRIRYGITPTADHYTCMVDLLGRAGQLDEALAFVRTMPLPPNSVVWHTLLGACQKWRNLEVGRHAFDAAVKLDNLDAAAYVLMSNIYTSAQMWEQAQELQTRRIRTSAWKEPGQSCWTDLDGVAHRFLVREVKER